ncbi:glycosyltransferase family 4 protein [bacterium]|nr:glycosyltransferase family 4 protein [bacterium]
MSNSKRIALISDAFPPMRSSGAIQILDLSLEFIKQGHQPTVVLPSSEIDCTWIFENWSGVQTLRIKAPKTKDVGYFQRTIGEFLMPFVMLRNLRKSPVAKMCWDGIVWYSPTIFWGPLVKSLKKSSSCRGYLIVRDIFPEWAVDIGLMRRGLPYLFFKLIERFQYRIADVIGVQTLGNVGYFNKLGKNIKRKVEVLQNWLAYAPNVGCSISVSESSLAGRKIFVYAGNMGVAQDMDILLDLAEHLRNRKDIGFMFVGRGSYVKRLLMESKTRGLENIAFYNEIDPSEIPGLYAQCHVGLIALDPRHKTHNIPGKFLSYMQSGLPVLASINPGNELVEIISQERVGRVCTDASKETLLRLAEELLRDIAVDVKIKARCQMLSTNMFSPKTAVNQIIHALSVVSAPENT